MPKIPSPPSAQKCIGRVFSEVVFLYSLRYYFTFQHLPLLIIPKLFSFSDQQNKQNVFGRVAEVAREHRWHPPKTLDSDENFKPEHTLFCSELRFVAIYALFGDFWAKKVFFGSKTVFLGQEVHYYMVYIAYFTELNSKI